MHTEQPLFTAQAACKKNIKTPLYGAPTTGKLLSK
jgi:hypothetical protein